MKHLGDIRKAHFGRTNKEKTGEIAKRRYVRCRYYEKDRERKMGLF